MGVLADQVVSLAAQVDEVVEAAGGLVPAVDDVRHVRGEDKRGPVPAPGQKGAESEHEERGCTPKTRVDPKAKEASRPHVRNPSKGGSGGRFPHLLMLPNICAWPRNLPKSMWNMWPVVLSMMLSLCRSQIPST